MAHTFTSLHFHCVFSTRQRANLIPEPFQSRLHGYLGGVVKNLDGRSIIVGGTANHVHLLIAIPPDMAVAGMVRNLKANSSKWIHETSPMMRGFGWQEGYGAFTVSRSNVDAVAQYIQRQAKHHKTLSFEDEYRTLMRKHGVEFEERYLLD
jgi:REP element-mobilizing transposase RayT